MRYKFIKSAEYHYWISNETIKSQVQIAKRLSLIELEGYFGDHKDVEAGVFELRWKNGRRLYYALIPEARILLLLGGNKNGQDKDISQSKSILKKWKTQNKT